MEGPDPKVTVVIPTYERPALLKRAVRSVYGQTYGDWEIIISDDDQEYGETWEWARAQSECRPRVTVTKNEFEAGQVGNTNNALVRARGDWIKILHDDDVLKPSCLAELMRVAALADDVACVTSGAQYVIDGEERVSGGGSFWPLLELIPEGEVVKAMYLTEDTGGALPSQKMIRRTVVENGVLMEQPKDLSWMVDSWFNARIGEQGALMIYRRPLVEWHQGAHSTETSSTDDTARLKEIEKFREMLWTRLVDQDSVPSPRVMKEVVLLQQAIFSLTKRDAGRCLSLIGQVSKGRSYLELFNWIAHRASWGKTSRARREILARNWDDLVHLVNGVEDSPPSGSGFEPLHADDKSKPMVTSTDIHSSTGEDVLVSSEPEIASPITADIDRVVMLHSRLSGYMAACLRALKRRTGAELMVMRYPPTNNAPFDDRHFSWIDHIYDGKSRNSSEIYREVSQFEPDTTLMAGWFDSSYMNVARRLRSDGVPVIAGCDTQWNASIRQLVGCVTAAWYLHPAIDALWVSGDRQRKLARKLGYTGDQCWEGYYSCDWERFEQQYDPTPPSPKSFLYVGRYVERKGVNTLLEAYNRYRLMSGDPWPLFCAGAGPLQSEVRGTSGVVDVGFIQPTDMPEFMANHGVFILPSDVEPWGVVVHEAASAGLPIISSVASGASVHLVRDMFNGFLFEPGDTDHLVNCMLRVSDMSEEDISQMGESSHQLSKQFTPQKWANTFIEASKVLRNGS